MDTNTSRTEDQLRGRSPRSENAAGSVEVHAGAGGLESDHIRDITERLSRPMDSRRRAETGHQTSTVGLAAIGIRPFLIPIVLSLGVWTIFATLVVPALIQTAYRGESWTFLNRLITGQATHTVRDYLEDWNRVTILGFLGCLGIWLVVFVMTSRALSGRLPILYRGLALLALNTLVLLAAFEFVARHAMTMGSMVFKPAEQLLGEGEAREKISYYATQDWAAQYWYEFRLARKQRYYPYVGWRRAPFEGKTIHIDQHGIRLTPSADCGPGSYKVFAFGGSTMWGTGAPDWGTIPAYLQAGLQAMRPGPVCVVNFGETAYVATQGVILLLLQLKSGNVPDLVVFYDGPNNVYAAYQSGRVGFPENLDQVAAKFEKGPPTIVEWLKGLNSYSLIGSLTAKLTATKPGQEEVPPANLSTYASRGVDAAALSQSILQDYVGSYQMVTTLAQKYGFDAFFFVQPIVSMGNKPLTTEEQHIKQRMLADDAFNKLCTSVYRAVEVELTKYRTLYSLVHLFDDHDSLLWIDDFHVTPPGNRIIADKMLDVIKAHAKITS